MCLFVGNDNLYEISRFSILLTINNRSQSLDCIVGKYVITIVRCVLLTLLSIKGRQILMFKTQP